MAWMMGVMGAYWVPVALLTLVVLVLLALWLLQQLRRETRS